MRKTRPFTLYGPLVVLVVLTSCLAVVLGNGEGASSASFPKLRESSGWRHEFTPDSPAHPIQKTMKAYVEDMLEHAIDGYLTYAFPKDELASLSGKGKDSLGGVYTTLIDSLDTLALMNRPKLFRRLAKWVEDNVSFDKSVTVSGFETNIRIVGGLLGAHFMYEEGIVPVVSEEHDYNGGLLRLAVDLADRLLPAFDTVTGIPFGSINLRSGVAADETLSTATASAGTYLMEMIALSRATGDDKYEAAARRASQAVYDLRHRPTDLLGSHINISTGEWLLSWASVGTGVDSTIEYWLKGHALSGEVGEWDRFARIRHAASSFLREGGFYLEKNLQDPSSMLPVVHHCSLSSFYPGCLTHAGSVKEAAEAAWSAHGLFRYYGALPEQFILSYPAAQLPHHQFPLRPEHAESLYHLYRATKDPAYLKMGREFAIALNLRTRTPYGFAALDSVLFPHSRASMSDGMESFMISETLKYLYLLFDECNPIHMPYRQHQGGPLANNACHQDAELLSRTSSRDTLVGWEFTTEAHLFPNHIEWLVPLSATADYRRMPPGLVGTRLESRPFTNDASLLGQVTNQLLALSRAGARQRLLSGANASTQLVETLQREASQRAAEFFDSPQEARRKTVLGLVDALGSELHPLRMDAKDPQASPWVSVRAKHMYYCANHPMHGLDRLSKSVYREVTLPTEY